MKISVRTLLLCIMLLGGLPIVWSQDTRFSVMEYNVENLFDCKHDSTKNDMEFLPEAIRGWNSRRFYAKVNDLAKTIWAASIDYAPDIVGLCEVENEFCIRTLVHYSALKEVNYQFLITDSPDERGINVALLYQQGRFGYLGHESLRVPPPEGLHPTRDILHAWGRVSSGDTLDVFVVHFPSRIGRHSETYRCRAAELLKWHTDSLQQLRHSPRILIMGDFNAYSSSKSIASILCGGRFPLVDLTLGLTTGNYKFKGEWGLLDHILVNEQMLQSSSRTRINTSSLAILKFDYLLEEDETYGGDRPRRTYRGMRYQGGVSDHLPLRAELTITE